MKKYLALMLAMICLLCGCAKQATSETTSKPAEEKAPAAAPEEAPAEEAALTGKVQVEIVVKDYGTIALELDADAAPKTTANFVKLVKEGFYDGLTFHRVVAGFVIQGGDPLGNGTGGSKESIVGEFAANGIENPISHTRGVISMARAQDPNSASSQFFIMHEDNHGLDGQYAAFGCVTEGMEVVDAICADAQPVNQMGLLAAEAQPVIESITVVK